MMVPGWTQRFDPFSGLAGHDVGRPQQHQFEGNLRADTPVEWSDQGCCICSANDGQDAVSLAEVASENSCLVTRNVGPSARSAAARPRAKASALSSSTLGSTQNVRGR